MYSRFSYEWKVDFAVLVSLLAVSFTIIRWIIEKRGKIRREKIQAYEQVFEDANFILLYPFKKKRADSRSVEYQHPDPEFQNAVRLYLDSHWMNRMYGMNKYLPSTVKDRAEQYDYMAKVQAEATSFQDKIFALQSDFTMAQMSPVFHMENDELNSRFANVMDYVGKHLSLFSPRIQRLWEDANYHDPSEVKHKYEKCLAVCPKFFRHNVQDFDDPYLEILDRIRMEYRALKQERIKEMVIALKLRISSIRYKAQRFFRKRM